MVFFHDHVGDVDALAARLAAFDVVVLMRERTPLGADLIARLPRLKLIVTVGLWNAAIDLAAAKAHGVIVSGTAGGDPAADAHVDLGPDPRGDAQPAYGVRIAQGGGLAGYGLGVDILGKSLGLLGLGKIGQAVARFGTAFACARSHGARILTAEQAAEFGVERVEKDALFREATC